MTTAESSMIHVASRFCGPPASANGGYICGLVVVQKTKDFDSGLVAARIHQPVTVRLQRPPPLETALELHGVAPGLWAVDHGGLRYMEARATEPLELAIPGSPGYVQALQSSLHGPDSHEHPCPGCFVCGPERARGDGLRIFAGPVPGSDCVAAAWSPDPGPGCWESSPRMSTGSCTRTNPASSSAGRSKAGAVSKSSVPRCSTRTTRFAPGRAAPGSSHGPCPAAEAPAGFIEWTASHTQPPQRSAR